MVWLLGFVIRMPTTLCGPTKTSQHFSVVGKCIVVGRRINTGDIYLEPPACVLFLLKKVERRESMGR